MKTNHLLLSLLCFVITAPALRAGSPEAEKAFTEKYKSAFEAKDAATLESFLYTKDANPMALGFYKSMMTTNAGDKITKIELTNLSPADEKKAAEVQEGPGGVKMRLSLKPTKKLKITIEKKDGDNSFSSTSESFVAEKDGRYVIPVPTDVK